MHRMVHRQLQRVHARAAVCIVVAVGISACHRVGFAVPRVGLADGFRLRIVRAVVDRQVQRHRAVSPVDVVVQTRVVARDRVRLAVPFVGLACLRRDLVRR